MPLPLLLIPVVAAAATTTATATSPLLIGGVGIGGVALGGLFAKVWTYFKSKPKNPESYHDSLVTQHRLTEDRIINAQEQAKAVYGEIQIVVADAKASTLLTTASIAEVRESSGAIRETSTSLCQAMKELDVSVATFSASIPALQAITSELHDDAISTTTKMEELSILLGEKEGAISAAKKDISMLLHRVTEQTTTLTQLESDVQGLAMRAKAQEILLVEKDNKLQQEREKRSLLKAETVVLRTDVVRLKEEAAHALRNCQFFKQVAEQAMTEQGSLQSSVNIAAKPI